MPRRSSPMLEVAGLSVRYGKVEAVREVSLAVAKGEVVTLIGPNGAGKTSTLNGLMGLAEAGGAASLAGTSIVGARPQDLVGLGLVLVPERRELFAGMTVRDNLLLGAFRRVMRRDDAVGSRSSASTSSSRGWPSGGGSTRAPSPEGSSRCSRSGAASWPTPRCSCSTSLPWGWRHA